jgi:hypothetical protein
MEIRQAVVPKGIGWCSASSAGTTEMIPPQQ